MVILWVYTFHVGEYFDELVRQYCLSRLVMRKQVGSVDELGKQQEATKEDLFTVQQEK